MDEIKICFICPYFGKLPDHFQLWLNSCKINYKINWYLIIDDTTQYYYPSNVHVEYMSFSNFCQLLQSKFSFKLNIRSPYKLCDFKPTYGYVFEEYLKGYNFWGYCDISDSIMGNIEKFLDRDSVFYYDKILFWGHMSLYKNSDVVNKRIFIQTASKKKLSEILGISRNMAFDELTEYSINTIYKENGFPLKRMDFMYRDISPLRYAFQFPQYNSDYVKYHIKNFPCIFEWNRGQLFCCLIDHHELKKVEIGYVHFQKRTIINHINGQSSHYILTPKGIFSIADNVTANDVEKFSVDKLFYKPFFLLKYQALKYRINNIFNLIRGKNE